MTPRIDALPYRPDGADYFESIADLPWAVFLDSGPPEGRRGRWDILAAAPRATFVTRGDTTTISTAQADEVSLADPLALLRAALPVGGGEAELALPFCGGAIGYFAYDLGRRWLGLPSRAGDTGLPDMATGIYDWAVLLDHDTARAWLVGDAGRVEDAEWRRWRAHFQASAEPVVRPALRRTGPIRANLDPAAYCAAFERVQAYIRAGDCYQVNLALRFGAPVTGDPWSAYRRLRARSPAPHGAFMRLPFAAVLSNSPERFLRVCDGRVETRPIKGTRPRRADPRADAAEAEALLVSGKDRAENLMIVDLLRNDLGKVCDTGTVRVEQLFGLESYANVHHLVSAVGGDLRHGLDGLDALRAAFPGGSITGAPKLRAMQIIDELEPSRRDLYCGSIGHVGAGGDLDSSIAIRTLVVADGEARFSAGGGIVADSDWQREYRECLDKAAPMFELLDADPHMGDVAGLG